MPSLSETWLTSAPSAGLDREAVVLDGDEHAARAGHAHGVVRAAVAERKLERPQAEREPEQLVAEADAEERAPCPSRLAHGLDGPSSCAGSPGPLPISTAARVEREDRVGVPGAPGTTTASRPVSASRRTIERLQPKSSTTTRGPAPTVYGSATQA